MNNFTKIMVTMALAIFSTAANFAQTYRTIDGYNNNLVYKDWGAVGTNQLAPLTTGFADGISEPAGPDRPNARFISNAVFMQNTLANDPRGLSAYCWAWGQFIDHDITLVEDHPTEALAVAVPMGDVFFDPAGTGTATIPFHRSGYDPLSGTDVSNPRKFVNSITAFIDASGVYGSSEERAAWLRTFSDGKLKTSAGNLLPWNTTTGELDAAIDPTAPSMAMPLPFVQKWFVAGDVRANENPFLTGMHTLFVREHNRLCEAKKTTNPDWTDEQLYQYARKLVGAQMQAIVYEEWLPTMGMEVDAYGGYDSSKNPGIMNVFSAAAYRYGHTTINSVLARMDNEGHYLPEGNINLRNAYFNPNSIVEVNGIEPYLVGMATMVQQDFDCKVVDDLRNFLFGPPGAGGLDLVALNIARGRERGLPDYNTVRAEFGLETVADFSEMSADPLMNQTLEFVYGDINKIDPWVGMLSENHIPDALFGKTAMTIIERQFMALRDGDRFYYECDLNLSAEEKEWVKATRLSDIIRRNTPVTIVQDDIFMVQPFLTATEEASSRTALDFSLYPNPAQGMVSLWAFAEGNQTANIRIADLNGRTLLQQEALLSAGNNSLTLTLPTEWAPGMYIISVQAGDKVEHQRLVKQ